MASPRLSVIIASTRPHRIGHQVAEWALQSVPAEFDVTVHDLRELALPFLDEPGQPADGNYAHEHTRQWSAAMQATDALVLVMPEYNRGYNAALKNAIDFLYAEWEGLPVGCVGYGWHGASYAKSALRQTLERVKMTVVDGPGLSFGKTLTQEGEVSATDEDDAGAGSDVRRAARQGADRSLTDRLAVVSREVWSAASADVLPRPSTPESPMSLNPLRPRLFARTTWQEAQHVAGALRTETVGGALLLAAAVARWPGPTPRGTRHTPACATPPVGPHALHLDLTLGQWAADGLLAIFFFVAGLELKREFLVGELRTPAKAALPVAAAVCGVALPALVYAVTVTFLGAEGDALGAGRSRRRPTSPSPSPCSR